MSVVDQQCANGSHTQIERTSATGHVREALAEDIPALVSLEEACFNSDRLSRRSFRHLITEGNSVTLIDHTADQARGYITLLFRADVSLARVYSIATAPGWLGKGVASGLLRAAEELALSHNCVAMRLEIRKDNLASQQLFLRHGYAVFSEHAGYYEDGMDALRFEKSLTARLRPELARTTYYRQT
ncbi:GNAT family N-acetyltransferase [Massilia sp. TWR1-2-2]|uniref:GNAT family N-acetyltransferase n=1 Tax=Massilia sp. TWR1-2-2 TaxID=2804584 RepID=UPI003CF6EE43